jgi:hypothetical protein
MRVVFIHGAFSRDGAWWFAPTAELLHRRGIASAAVALPSCGEAGIAPTGTGPGLHEDAAATTAVLDADGPAILVAHSYGGMVATQGRRASRGQSPRLHHVVPPRRRRGPGRHQHRSRPRARHPAGGRVGQRRRRRHRRVQRSLPARRHRPRAHPRSPRAPLPAILRRLRRPGDGLRVGADPFHLPRLRERAQHRSRPPARSGCPSDHRPRVPGRALPDALAPRTRRGLPRGHRPTAPRPTARPRPAFRGPGVQA